METGAEREVITERGAGRERGARTEGERKNERKNDRSKQLVPDGIKLLFH